MIRIGELLMKKLCLVLAITILALTLVSCGGGFESVRRGMQNAGYTYYFPVGEEELITTISRELDKLGVEHTVHYFKKTLAADMGVETTSIGAFIELEKSGDVDVIFNDAGGNTLISLIENYKSSDHIRGNAILFSITKNGEAELVAAFKG